MQLIFDLSFREDVSSSPQLSDTSVVLEPVPAKPALEHSTSICEVSEALLSAVTHQYKLDLLINLYSKCLSGKLCSSAGCLGP